MLCNILFIEVLFGYCPTEIREAFRVLDRDGNGFISKQELGMAMRSLGYMPSEVELAIIMQRLDMDGESLKHSLSHNTPLPELLQDCCFQLPFF